MKIPLHKAVHAAFSGPDLLRRQRKGVFVHHEQKAQIILPQVIIEAVLGRELQEFPHRAIGAFPLCRAQRHAALPRVFQFGKCCEHAVFHGLTVHQ